MAEPEKLHSQPTPQPTRQHNALNDNSPHLSSSSLSLKHSLPGTRRWTERAKPEHARFHLSLRVKVLLTMVAIPAYLVASTALSSMVALPTRPPRQTALPSQFQSPTTSFVTLTSHSAFTSRATLSAYPSIVPSNSDDFASLAGPVIQVNFPDPAIIYVEGVSYAFATNNRVWGPGHINVQMAYSNDNETWFMMNGTDALPRLGRWETGGRVWAPDVVQVDDGSFVLYYADEVSWAPAHHCIGAATSKDVTGPYTPLDEPLVCPDVHTLGGAIDPDGFLDQSTGKRYISYKVDGNSIGHGGLCGNSVAPVVPTPIMLQEVDADGITFIGENSTILDRDQLDGPLIEAPALHRSDDGIYFLFFSSNCFTTPLYDTSYATSTSIWGPYTKSERPLFVTGDGPGLIGPGGMDIIKDGDLFLFHGHLTTKNDPDNKQLSEVSPNVLTRGMYTGRATFQGTQVLLTTS